MKRDVRNSSKKGLPKNLRRISKPDGTRVWRVGKSEYRTLAEVRYFFTPKEDDSK